MPASGRHVHCVTGLCKTKDQLIEKLENVTHFAVAVNCNAGCNKIFAGELPHFALEKVQLEECARGDKSNLRSAVVRFVKRDEAKTSKKKMPTLRTVVSYNCTAVGCLPVSESTDGKKRNAPGRNGTKENKNALMRLRAA